MNATFHCRNPVRLSSTGISGLKTNFALMELLPLLSAISTLPTPPTQSASSKPRTPNCAKHLDNVTHYCMDCVEHLCVKCLTDALRDQVHRDHTIVELSMLEVICIIDQNVSIAQKTHDAVKEAEKDANNKLIRRVEMIHQEVESRFEEAIAKINVWKTTALNGIDEAACREDATISSIGTQFKNELAELIQHRAMAFEGTLGQNLVQRYQMYAHRPSSAETHLMLLKNLDCGSNILMSGAVKLTMPRIRYCPRGILTSEVCPLPPPPPVPMVIDPVPLPPLPPTPSSDPLLPLPPLPRRTSSVSTASPNCSPPVSPGMEPPPPPPLPHTSSGLSRTQSVIRRERRVPPVPPEWRSTWHPETD